MCVNSYFKFTNGKINIQYRGHIVPNNLRFRIRSPLVVKMQIATK